jgi:colanic acid/amylovoran biosynthesis glycosyltransferase
MKHPAKSFKLLKEAKKAGYSRVGQWRMLAVLSNFLKLETDWVHFAFATMAIERAFIGKVLGAQVGISFRGYDLSVYPLLNKGCYDNAWPFINKVHSISNYLLQQAYRMGLPTSVKNEVIKPATHFSRAIELSERKGETKKLSIVTVARLHWIKGIEDTLKALSQVSSDFNYTVIGDGLELERLIFASHQLGIAEKVSFVGKLNHLDVLERLKQCDLYIQYSHDEGFCNAALEAKSLGLPCIISNAPGLVENVGEYGLVVSKRNPSALSDALNEFYRLIKKSTTSSQMKLVKNDSNTEDQLVKKFVEFYEEG